MRGSDEQTSHMFSYLSPEQRVRADHPLRAIRAMTDRVFAELSPRFTKMYSDIGRPSIPPEQLLRALVLQSLYTVRSERLLMEEIDYSVLFRWFVGLGMDDPIWSPTTFSKNRECAGELARTRGCKSRPTKAVAGRSEPSLAGVAATRGPKRRQGSCGVRKGSPERVNVVEAETVPVVEGQVYAIAIARWRRSTGVVDRITYERSSLGPGRPDRGRRYRR